ncbi:head-tail joining protein [Methylobacter marinus]|uniref:head-tail joining protein n=1 Tax=Methylobacter marinus TaxID=34058 RepID=UPI00036C3BF4|nr:hypothetical protein [Methylobacter marinus]
MTDFYSLMPDSLFTETLGDDVTYHAKAGDIEIKAFVDDYLEPVFSGEAHVQEGRKRIDVAVADAPGLKKGMKFTHNGVKYTVDDIIANDGQFASCVVS